MLRKFCLSAIVVNLCVLDFNYIVETSSNIKLVSADCPMSLVSENMLSLVTPTGGCYKGRLRILYLGLENLMYC